MIPLLLILIPIVSGILSFFLKTENAAKYWAIFSSLVTLFVTLFSLGNHFQLTYNVAWLPTLGSSFSLGMDGMSKILCLLTAVAYPLVFGSTLNNHFKRSNSFYGFMLLMQAGLMGVFLASDILLFYFFWELALIPAYFLCSQWGGERRIAVTFKFFVYTFVGSLVMLIGILFLYFKTLDHSFALQSFYHLKLSHSEQYLGFWLFFVAFAIKMPIFPFHTWQPDTYEQSETAVTMILSGVMVKMGLYATIRWVLPIFPDAVSKFSQPVIILCVIGMLYASLIAIKQNDIKRLIAYSSIAHIGLMCAAIFTNQSMAMEGLLIQLFNHGINVIGLWIVADAIEQQFGTRKFSELGGLAKNAPGFAILFMVMILANVALPLTNSFIGEFLMFNGLFRYNFWIAAFAIISVILVAVYSLNMFQKIAYGKDVNLIANAPNNINDEMMLAVLMILILALGVYPQPLLQLTHNSAHTVLALLHR